MATRISCVIIRRGTTVVVTLVNTVQITFYITRPGNSGGCGSLYALYRIWFLPTMGEREREGFYITGET